MLWKMTEWKAPSGQWYCNCVDKLASNAGAWYTPARILGWEPADYVEYVIKNYHPNVFYSAEKCLVFFSWDSQSDMRKYKNWLNKIAREKNFQI